MQMIHRAIWFIEAHLSEPLTLDQVAEAAGATRFSLSHVFVATTGMTTLGYVRARRLSVAAKALAAGAPDILELALEAGYGSHEAFTRAFRERFGRSPTEVRERRSVSQLLLQEAYSMTNQDATRLSPPRWEELPALRLTGLREHFSALAERARIPGLWQRFAPHIGHIPGQIGGAAYGVSYDFDPTSESFSYLAAVQVTSTSQLPTELASFSIPAQRYAVFRHDGHVSEVGATINAIFNSWAPASGHKFGDTPNCLERYGAEFDGLTGNGGFDILIPVVN